MSEENEKADDREKIRQTVSKRLRMAREAKGYTQEQVQTLMKYKSSGTVSTHEKNGGHLPSPDELFRLSRLYGVTMNWLYGLTDDPQGNKSDNGELMKFVDEKMKTLNGLLLTDEEKEDVKTFLKKAFFEIYGRRNK